MIRFAVFLLFVLVSCAPVPQDAPPTRALTTINALPPMKAFGVVRVRPSSRPNADIAQDFLDLTFDMESGRAIPFMTRFSGPITVRVAGQQTAQTINDLQALLSRLRNEAGIDIQLTSAAQASITIEAVPQATLQRAVPRAACFVVPRVTGWRDYLAARATTRVDWTTLAIRDRAVIFIPSDVAPQEIRDCLHEELAQALGPLNDLYRLPDSVFNDDNIHTVLTGFDMLVLRAYYAPELANGMTRAQVSALLPGLLSRLNPSGQVRGGVSQSATARDWITAIETALTNSAPSATRRAAAQNAIAIARNAGWTGPRLGFSYYAYGRLQVGNDPTSALTAFDTAEAIYRATGDTDIHAAHIAVQKAAFTLAAGDATGTLAQVDGAIPVASAYQNAALLSTLMMIKATALDMQGNTVAANAVRLDSLGWARYGFGADANVQARLDEIAALRPF
jgi:hypothetical protein